MFVKKELKDFRSVTASSLSLQRDHAYVKVDRMYLLTCRARRENVANANRERITLLGEREKKREKESVCRNPENFFIHRGFLKPIRLKFDSFFSQNFLV